MKVRKTTLRLALFSLAFATMSVACDVGKDADINPHTEEMGTLQLKLTDAPIDDVESVFVTFSEIAVHYCDASSEDDDDKGGDDDQENDKNGDEDQDGENEQENDKGGDEDQDGENEQDNNEQSQEARDAGEGDDDKGGDDDKDGDDDKNGDDAADKEEAEKGEACENGAWKRIKLAESTKFDLLTLQNGKTADLGMNELPAGHYGQIRLKLEAASIVVKGEEVDLKVPSGSKSGLKINGGFDVVADETLSLTIDFDAGKSLKENKGQGWMLKPVIKLLK